MSSCKEFQLSTFVHNWMHVLSSNYPLLLYINEFMYRGPTISMPLYIKGFMYRVPTICLPLYIEGFMYRVPTIYLSLYIKVYVQSSNYLHTFGQRKIHVHRRVHVYKVPTIIYIFVHKYVHVQSFNYLPTFVHIRVHVQSSNCLPIFVHKSLCTEFKLSTYFWTKKD